ncbi:hypothetical protein GCM10010329_15380 [Streptomyces spiroverticillatus]|uniref:DUF2277 family protein n=2 Tax=Streptomyces finlayi TaxID=67296 RepID=A0A918X303_9ACTN|nr:hypothetical protein GCM10010329_15380 [Streptomyces spiroverticillatus]GHD07151.1 hypothetical protein GCM10010334_59410 [Streptomyces finlayi]
MGRAGGERAGGGVGPDRAGRPLARPFRPWGAAPPPKGARWKRCRARGRGALSVGGGSVRSMCRSIKTLRPPAIPEEATSEEIAAAALQYVRKISGFRAPAAHNKEVFDQAVEDVAAATAALLAGLEVRGRRTT